MNRDDWILKSFDFCGRETVKRGARVFILAFERVLALTTGALMMIALWVFFRFPHANFLLAAFVFLTSANLVGVRNFSERLHRTAVSAVLAAMGQFMVGMTWNMPLLQVLLPAFFAWGILTVCRRSDSCIILLISYFACFAEAGFLAAADRSLEIAVGAVVVTVVTGVVNGSLPEKIVSQEVQEPYSCRRALMIAVLLAVGCCFWKFLHLKQGPWIMLTILFICQAQNGDSGVEELVYLRIFSVPLGILLGGLYISSFCGLDYRFVYWTVVIGTAGFAVLYFTGNYFLFTVLFMMTFTISADWLNGTVKPFYFLDFLFSRSISTTIGAILLLAGDALMRKGTVQRWIS